VGQAQGENHEHRDHEHGLAADGEYLLEAEARSQQDDGQAQQGTKAKANPRAHGFRKTKEVPDQQAQQHSQDDGAQARCPGRREQAMDRERRHRHEYGQGDTRGEFQHLRVSMERLRVFVGPRPDRIAAS